MIRSTPLAAGGEGEVVWQVRFNHGGGYSYRLCPAEDNLTEACFQVRSDNGFPLGLELRTLPRQAKDKHRDGKK